MNEDDRAELQEKAETLLARGDVKPDEVLAILLRALEGLKSPVYS